MSFQVPVAAQSSVALEITSANSLPVDEGMTVVAVLTATDNLTWSKSVGDDADSFSLAAGSVLTFEEAKDHQHPDDADADGVYEVTVQACDGVNTLAADLNVTLSNVIELKAITGSSVVGFAENGRGRVATFSAPSGAERDGIEWAITGADAGDFTIDNPPGALRLSIDPVSPEIFPTQPDFAVTGGTSAPAEAEDPHCVNKTHTARLRLTTTASVKPGKAQM